MKLKLGTQLRYGSLSVMALVNAIMLAGSAKAADATANDSNTPNNNGTAPPKKAPATPTKPATAASASGGATQLPPVVVTAQAGSYQATQASLPYYTQPLLDTPESITIVPQAVIRDQNATTLRDILRNVPGISFQAGEASSTVAGDNLSIRGFNARDDMFIDGIRDTGIYTRDPFNTESVEVVKGPASAYEGYGETGGSVNLISKTPDLTPDYEFSGGVGTNTYHRETMDINQPISEFGNTGMAFRLNAMQQYNDVAARNFVNDGRWGFAPSFAFGLGTPTRVIVSYLHQREDDLPDYGFPFINATAIANGTFPKTMLNRLAPLPYDNWYGFLYRDHETAITDMPTLTIQHDFEGGAKIENQTRYDRTKFDAFNVSARFDAPLPINMITREASARSDVDSLVDNKTFATIPFETWHVPNILVASLEISHENDIFSTATGPNTTANLYDPNAFAAYTGKMTWTAPTTNQLDDIAASLFDTLKFTPQWELTGGMRFDHLNTSTVQLGSAKPAQYAESNNLASWRVALVYKPLPNGSIYAGYGTSYNPSIQGIADGAGNDGFVSNTSKLAPEEDTAYELGTKWDLLDEKLSVTGALFRTNKTNTRVTDPTMPGTVYILSGLERVQGAELDVAGSLTKEWKVFGGYVWMPSKVVSGPSTAFPGHVLPNTPQQTASMWTTYDLPFHFTVGTGMQYVDQRYAGVNNLNSVPGYATQMAMLRYQANENVDIQLNVTNLWNNEYIDLVGAHQAVPGAGRTFIVTTSLKF
jgi:catecholate siderophore receptor